MISFIGVVNSLLVGFIGFVILRNYDFAEIDYIESYKNKQSIVVEDSNGEEIFKDGPGYEPVGIDHIPNNLINALIATEDVSFWVHPGINPFSMISAVGSNIAKGRIVRGGSTITQQLAKSILYECDPTIARRKVERKIRELMIALRIEKKFNKDQIIEMYLNRVYFGRGAYGVSAAAKAFFGKSLESLTLYECAYLIGLVQKPSLYAGNGRLAIERALHVLRRMEKTGYISGFNRSEIDKLILIKQKNRFGQELFGEWVVKRIPKEILEMNIPIYVRTTFDSKSQRLFVESIEEIQKNSRVSFSQLGFLACDRTGGIRVMVGGIDPTIRGLNRCIQPRQAGSIFKIYIYLLGFMKNMHPNEIIDDVPISFGSWAPGNYKYQSVGSIFVKDAFAESVNSIALSITKSYGLSNLINLARQMGVSGHIENDMSIALGSICITLSQLMQSMLIIMNNGYQIVPYGIVEIRDAAGKVIWKKDMHLPQKFIDNDCAFWSMKETMVHTVESPRGTARNAKVANSKRAGKTGTTGTGDGPIDLWFACFDDEISCCAWFGNDDGSMMQEGAGSKNPAVFSVAQFMSNARQNMLQNSKEQIKSMINQNGVREANICDLPGVFDDPFSC